MIDLRKGAQSAITVKVSRARCGLYDNFGRTAKHLSQDLSLNIVLHDQSTFPVRHIVVKVPALPQSTVGFVRSADKIKY